MSDLTTVFKPLPTNAHMIVNIIAQSGGYMSVGGVTTIAMKLASEGKHRATVSANSLRQCFQTLALKGDLRKVTYDGSPEAWYAVTDQGVKRLMATRAVLHNAINIDPRFVRDGSEG